MRKKKKNKILSLLECYGVAHSAIEGLIEEGRKEEAASLMVLCREGMDKVEQDCVKEREVDDAEKNLSDSFAAYQEALFLSYETLFKEDNPKEEENKKNKLIKELEADKDKALTRALSLLKGAEEIFKSLEYKIKKIPIHTLILFLPYKASMWDSMESVYFAAMKDCSCEALVMPISYFERAKDRSFGLEKNEREQFPEGISLVGEEYSIEEERPDIIYIHNPYDDCNTVTSVHPRYYSSNLKKYTENLIFIPYQANFRMTILKPLPLPAYQNVDYIVVQNEEHRKAFLEEFREKCVILGSPKYDKLLSLMAQKPEMPEEWKKISMGRELYYFNSGLAGMLKDTELFLRKTEEVFDAFRGNSKYCLLWRPHPLLENTFLTMRKEYQNRFLDLKKKYLEEEIGIYDDSGEPERAVILSSAYIGDDASSMVSLFSVAEKALFIQNTHFLTSEEESYQENRLFNYFKARESYALEQQEAEALVYEGRVLLIPRYEGDDVILTKLDLLELGISGELLRQIPADEYGEAYFDKGRWIFTPKAGNHFLIIEEGKRVKKCPLPNHAYRPNSFSATYRSGDFIFCKAENYPFSICFSLRNDEIIEIEPKSRKAEILEGFFYKMENTGGADKNKGNIIFLFPKEELVFGFLPWRKFSYGLKESSFYGLQEFIEKKPLLYPFDKKISEKMKEEISVNLSSAGERIHFYFREQFLNHLENKAEI